MALPFHQNPTTDFNETKYRREFWLEYTRQNRYSKYMGAKSEGEMAIIHLVNELKEGGETVKIPLLGRSTSQPIVGDTQLAGRETPINVFEQKVQVEYHRDAKRLSRRQEKFAYAKVLQQVKPLLKNQCDEWLRDHISDAFGMVKNDVTIHAPKMVARAISATPGVDPAITWVRRQANAAEANKWVTDNFDNTAARRIYFGTDGNGTASDFAASIASLDTTADACAARKLEAMKDLAETGDPHVRPVKSVDDTGEEWLVGFAGPKAFRQLERDPEIIENTRHAMERGSKNRLFTAGDLIHMGMIIRKIPEMPLINATPAGGGYTLAGGTANVDRVFLCGAQTIAVAYGQDTRFTMRDDTDYQFFNGVGIEECYGFAKMQRTNPTTGVSIDHGVVTGFFASLS